MQKSITAYMVIDAAGGPGRLANDVAPIRWSARAAKRLAAWLDRLDLGQWKRGPHGVVEIEIVKEQQNTAGAARGLR